MPPANIQRLHTPRTAATVLGEIREALGDYHETLTMLEGIPSHFTACEIQDQATAFECLIDELRDEFNARVQSALGLSVEDLRAAYSEALI